MSLRLRRFVPVEPFELLRGPYGEWVTLILLCGLFIAVAGAVLPQRLTERRSGKAVTVFVGLIMGIGLYSSRRLFNFNFESFGFLAIFIIVLLMIMATYGLAKLGMGKDVALSLTYCITFLTFFVMSPSLFDTFADTLPILNGIFFLAFFYLLGKLIWKMVRHGSTETALKAAQGISLSPPDSAELEKEIGFEEHERNLLKHSTIRLTKKELKSIDNVLHYLKQIRDIIEDAGSQLNDQHKKDIIKALENINQAKQDFLGGLARLNRYILKYKAGDSDKMHKLRERFHQAKDHRKKLEIQREWLFEKKKMDIYEFMQKEADSIRGFIQSFDTMTGRAVQELRAGKFPSAIKAIDFCLNYIEQSYEALKKLKRHEFYLLKVSKREEKVEKREKKNK